MKRRVALGALVVLAGVVSLGALLMLSGLSVSASTEDYVLGVGRNHDPDVGTVQVFNDGMGNMEVRYSTDSPWCLTEVHVCVSKTDFDWVAPGSRKKCEDDPPKGAGGVHFGMEFECTNNYVVLIDLNEVTAICDETLHIQAHAVVENDGDQETAYGDAFKANFPFDLCPCPE